MADINLVQTDADALIAMEKQRIDDEVYNYPSLGGALHVPLQSPDKRERFMLDVSRSRIKLTKATYQNRARSVVILVRLDFGGAPHRNPDDEEIQCPHLHIYREGFGDRWAKPLPAAEFPGSVDPWKLLADFMKFVNITAPPDIRQGLFP